MRALEDAGTRAVAVSHGAAIRTWLAARCLGADAAMVSDRVLANAGIAVVEGSTSAGWRLAGWVEEIPGERGSVPPTGTHR